MLLFCLLFVLWYCTMGYCLGWGTTLAHAYTIHVEVRGMGWGLGDVIPTEPRVAHPLPVCLLFCRNLPEIGW